VSIKLAARGTATRTVNDEIQAPMGGVRDSGWGRTGPDSLKEFQDVIWINSHSGQRQYPI
jgi:acyl-CoA reductase-like NAD-dependent aldehyde dehydrogenase